VVPFVQGCIRSVDMRVDQTGQHHSTLQVLEDGIRSC
jgi:hypothetical protein